MTKAKMVVPVCEPVLGFAESANVQNAITSGWISGYKGKYLDEFEQRFADYCGYEYGITTSSCATALLLTLESLGIGKGDEVITTAFTMIATVSAIIHAGATPVLVDIEPDTWNMNPDLIEAKITKRTKAIMPVPIYGHPVDLVAIHHIANRRGRHLYVIEDAAEAIGSRYTKYQHHRPNAACYSFYINKMITTGEGGMIVTNSKELADMARRLKGYDTDPESRFVHQRLGFNYRMTNMQAAVGCAQMDRIDDLVAKKRLIALRYLEELGGQVWLQMPVEKSWAVNSYWVFAMLVKDGFHVDRDNLVARLSDAGIETRNFFVPMHKQPALLNLGLFRGEQYPVAEDVSGRGLYLPNGADLTVEQVGYVCKYIWSAV